jgi:hypothetical protein
VVAQTGFRPGVYREAPSLQQLWGYVSNIFVFPSPLLQGDRVLILFGRKPEHRCEMFECTRARRRDCYRKAASFWHGEAHILSAQRLWVAGIIEKVGASILVPATSCLD